MWKSVETVESAWGVAGALNSSVQAVLCRGLKGENGHRNIR